MQSSRFSECLDPVPIPVEKTPAGESKRVSGERLKMDAWLLTLTNHPVLSAWVEKHSALQVFEPLLKENPEFLTQANECLGRLGYAGFVAFLKEQVLSFSDEQLWDLLYAANQCDKRWSYNILKISPSARYFVSVCTYGPHSYVMAGCDDSAADSDEENSSKRYIFSAAGKNKTDEAVSVCRGIARILSGGMPTLWMDEALIKKKADIPKREAGLSSAREVYYRAYEVSYQQYLDYTYQLESIGHGNYNYYKIANHRRRSRLSVAPFQYAFTTKDAKLFAPLLPKDSKEDLAPKSTQPQGGSKNATYCLLTLGNTCRHAALNFLSGLKIKDAGISRFWTSNPPNKMRVQDGRIISPLFIVPIPPELALQEAKPFLYTVLQMLHNDILRLSQTNYGLALARRKIRVLNELYKNLHETENDAKAVRSVIVKWKESHESLVAEVRPRPWAFFHFKKTSSLALIEGLEQYAARDAEHLAAPVAGSKIR